MHVCTALAMTAGSVEGTVRSDLGRMDARSIMLFNPALPF